MNAKRSVEGAVEWDVKSKALQGERLAWKYCGRFKAARVVRWVFACFLFPLVET